MLTNDDKLEREFQRNREAHEAITREVGAIRLELSVFKGKMGVFASLLAIGFSIASNWIIGRIGG